MGRALIAASALSAVVIAVMVLAYMGLTGRGAVEGGAAAPGLQLPAAAAGGYSALYSIALTRGNETSQAELYFAYGLDKTYISYGAEGGVSVKALIGNGSMYVLRVGEVAERLARFYNGTCIVENRTSGVVIGGLGLVYSESRCLPPVGPLPTPLSDIRQLLGIPTLPQNDTRVLETEFGPALCSSSAVPTPGAVTRIDTCTLDGGAVYLLEVRTECRDPNCVETRLEARLEEYSDGFKPLGMEELEAGIPDVLAGRGAADVVSGAELGRALLDIVGPIAMRFPNNSDVSVIVFYDVSCPFCARLFTEFRGELLSRDLYLVDLLVREGSRRAHAGLRCIYNEDPERALDTLMRVYEALAGGDAETYMALVDELGKAGQCPFDGRTPLLLARMLVGDRVGTPIVVVVGDGTMEVVYGFDADRLRRLLS